MKKRYGMLAQSARLPYPKGKQRRKLVGCIMRLERVAKGQVPDEARPYLKSALNALNQALKEWDDGS